MYIRTGVSPYHDYPTSAFKTLAQSKHVCARFVTIINSLARFPRWIEIARYYSRARFREMYSRCVSRSSSLVGYDVLSKILFETYLELTLKRIKLASLPAYVRFYRWHMYVSGAHRVHNRTLKGPCRKMEKLREFRHTFHLQIKTHSRDLCRFFTGVPRVASTRSHPLSLHHRDNDRKCRAFSREPNLLRHSIESGGIHCSFRVFASLQESWSTRYDDRSQP